MTRGAELSTVAGLLVVSAVIWTMVPPFPSSATLLNASLRSLTNTLGAPGASGHTADSVTWIVPRGLGVWTLEAEWRAAPVPDSHPIAVSRSLRIRGTGIVVPIDTVVEARVMVPNNRWSGP